MSPILFSVRANRTSQWYGTLVVSNIHRAGNKPVNVKKYLVIKFKSPANVTNGEFWTTLPITSVVTSQKLDASTYAVTANIEFPAPYTLKTTDTFTFGINGDLNQNPSQFTNTFTIIADPVGGVSFEPEVSFGQLTDDGM